MLAREPIRNEPELKIIIERLEMRDLHSVYGKNRTNGVEQMMFVVRRSRVLRRVSMKHNSPVDAKIDRIMIRRFSLCQSGLFFCHTYHNWNFQFGSRK